MNKLFVLALASALSLPCAAMAKESQPPEALGRPMMVQGPEARQHEVDRRKILDAHTSWRWVVQVEVKDGGKSSSGLLLGMQGQGTTGPVRSIAWLNEEGEPQWMALEHLDKEGQRIVMLRDDFTADNWKEISQGQLVDRVASVLGTRANPEDLHAWASGVPTGASWPDAYAQDQAGAHPLAASMKQGEIVWAKWSAVETGKGEDLPLPGGWMLTRKDYEAVFLSVTLEAYEAYELPNPGWPFITKENRKGFQLKDEDPIAREDQLDYEQW